VKQRWLMFYSEAAYRRESKTFDKKIKTESEAQNKAWWHLSNRVFTCRDDAHNQAEAQKKEFLQEVLVQTNHLPFPGKL
jgi:transposase